MKKIFETFFTLFILIIFVVQPAFSASTLKFAQLSDTHLSTVRGDTTYKLLSKSKPLLEDAIRQINEEDVSFTVLTGDGIDKPTKQSLDVFIDEMNKLNEPWYFAVGNHDTDPAGEVTKAVLLQTLKKQNKNYDFNSTYYSFKPKMGFKCIVLDGALNDKRDSAGYIPPEELQWLDKTLKSSKNDVVLIFIHFPVLPPFTSKSHEIINAEEYKNILEKYDMPIGIFSGHYHMTKISKRGNILHVSTPSLAGFPNAFRIVSVTKDRKKVVFDIELKETDLKIIQKQAKITALGGGVYYGREKDRNARIVIDRKK